MVPTGFNDYVALVICAQRYRMSTDAFPGERKTPSKLHNVVIFVVLELFVSPFVDLRFVSKEVSEPQVCIRRSQDATIYAATDQ